MCVGVHLPHVLKFVMQVAIKMHSSLEKQADSIEKHYCIVSLRTLLCPENRPASL